MDTQVFWEILAQLFEDPSVRPADVIFTPSTLPDVFGPRYFELIALPIGASMALSDLGALRSSMGVCRARRTKRNHTVFVLSKCDEELSLKGFLPGKLHVYSRLWLKKLPLGFLLSCRNARPIN